MSSKGVKSLQVVLKDNIMIVKRKNKPQQFENLLHQV